MVFSEDTDIKTEKEPYITRERLKNALYSQRFEGFITMVIILNAVVLALLTYQFSEKSHHWLKLLLAIDLAILVAFVMELSLKIYAAPKLFFKNAWHIFDLIVVTISILGSGYPLTVFRALRVLRTLRIVTMVPSMRVVVESFLRALPGIGSVIVVMMLVIFVYSVVGTSLYRHIAPELFGDLQTSTFTMFSIMTLEGWADHARTIMAQQPMAWIFFVSYVAINSFAVFNLLIAVIINSMHKEYDDHAEEEREDIMEEVQALRRDMKILIEKLEKPS